MPHVSNVGSVLLGMPCRWNQFGRRKHGVARLLVENNYTRIYLYCDTAVLEQMEELGDVE